MDKFSILHIFFSQFRRKFAFPDEVSLEAQKSLGEVGTSYAIFIIGTNRICQHQFLMASEKPASPDATFDDVERG